jgi:hypothetical protein
MSNMTPSWEELERHHVDIEGDRSWQRRLRLTQALWREKQGLPIGTRSDSKPLGSRIAMPQAKKDLSNFLTDSVREVVRTELAAEVTRREEKLISEPRIYEDLLSSQPLCFNLFGEMKADLLIATAWARHLWPGRVEQVTRLEFEHSPGRRDERYLGNRTAFDVYLEHTVPDGGEGFIGIEVKYHESLEVKAAEIRPRVREVATASADTFDQGALKELAAPPLQQVWFDHLLALSMLEADGARWSKNGLFVLMHPVANEACYRVVNAYVAKLREHRTFQRMTLEEAVAALRVTCDGEWVEAFQERYLRYAR